MRNKNLRTENPKSKTVFAKKSFGQNFLVDQNYINKIISALQLKPEDTVIEIGPGRGALTEKLIESGANVIAIELERDMIAALNASFSGRDNFRLIESDALKVDFREIAPGAKLVANLPYYISTAILQKLIEQREVLSEMILMFQREVVERITAQPGNSERGFLTVLVEAYLDAEKLFDVPPSAFSPAPKVNSAVVRLIMKKSDGIEIADDNLFREIISTAFRQKRKTILNNLKGNFASVESALTDSQIEFQRRAETLTLHEWQRLSKLLKRQAESSTR